MEICSDRLLLILTEVGSINPDKFAITVRSNFKF